jgi:transposase-like protein
VRSEVGPVRLAVPRDRDASFTPALVAKGQREISPRRRNLTRST